MSGIESQQEHSQAIADISAQFVHDITTPLATIKMLANILESHLPTALSAYQQLKNQGVHLSDIPEEHYEQLESSARTIHKLAQQVNQAARDYWQQIDQQAGASNEAENIQKNEGANRISLENSLRILVAEDDAIHQKIAAKLLSKHQVDIAANGKEAVDLCHLQSYDIILMDLHMPIMDGSQAVIEIMRLTHRPLIIGLTNRPLGYEKKQLLQQGFNGFLEKPLRIDELTQLINILQPNGN